MKKLKERVKNPHYIEGIYNYCDRWCEKCPFTSRCLNYKMYEERFGDLRDKDLQNQEFWKRFSEMMKETFDMIKESMQEWGIDIQDIDGEPAQDNAAEDQFLVILAEEYSSKVTTWFEEPYYINEQKAIDLERDSVEIKEIIDIIHWYQYQIEVKLTRAFNSINLDDEISIKDMNGSVKVALIGIDRSIGAWAKFMEFILEREDSILDMLNVLQKMLTITEKAFPHARSFIRPGFDETSP